eukprot:973686-Pyramimonas_sp.AAC.1
MDAQGPCALTRPSLLCWLTAPPWLWMHPSEPQPEGNGLHRCRSRGLNRPVGPRPRRWGWGS